MSGYPKTDKQKALINQTPQGRQEANLRRAIIDLETEQRKIQAAEAAAEAAEAAEAAARRDRFHEQQVAARWAGEQRGPIKTVLGGRYKSSRRGKSSRTRRIRRKKTRRNRK